MEKETIVPKNISVVPQFEITPEQNKTLIQQVQKFVKEQMIKDVDFGVIPGVEKPSLLKPGAEKLCNIFGFGVEISEVDKVEDWDKGMFSYTYKAIVRNKRTGLVEAECIGSCNSKESKYAFRWVPAFKATQEMISMSNKQEERIAKSGKPFVWYRIPNEDIFTQVNTLQKMAQKRAMVGAVLIATRASGFLTQDVEDMGMDTSTEEPAIVYDPVPVEKPKVAQTLKPTSFSNLKGNISPAQINFIKKLCEQKDVKLGDLQERFSFSQIEELSKADASKVIDYLQTFIDVV